MSNKFQITAISGKGNAIIAKILIKKGELIFSEKPAIWHSTNKCDGFCSNCGKLIHTCVRCKVDECNAKYCHIDCLDEADNLGHQWLCGKKAGAKHKVLVSFHVVITSIINISIFVVNVNIIITTIMILLLLGFNGKRR